MRGACVVVVLMSMGVVGAQSGWMPDAAVEGVARQMAPRLEHAKVGIVPQKLLPSARAAVEELRYRLDQLGVQRIISPAPTFPLLKVPRAGEAHLDAMAAYGMCTYYLESRFANPPRNADADARLDAAMGPLSLAVTTMYLRHHYLAGGGTDPRLKGYLDGDPLNEAAAAVQQDPKLLDYTAGRCRAAVSALLD